jgi:hypothetical protein
VHSRLPYLIKKAMYSRKRSSPSFMSDNIYSIFATGASSHPQRPRQQEQPLDSLDELKQADLGALPQSKPRLLRGDYFIDKGVR